MMTSKVTVEAQSHPCEVQIRPRVGDEELWETLSPETMKFARHQVPVGEKREFFVHANQSILVREAQPNAR